MDSLIQITNALMTCSNALVAFLVPQMGEFAERVGLFNESCSIEEVRRFVPLNEEKGGWIEFNNGSVYCFRYGYIQSFETVRSFYALQDPNRISEFYGPVKMTDHEVVQLARRVIKNLGYSQEMVYADLEPEVQHPQKIGTNTIPYFLIRWPAVNRAITSARFEINANTKSIESIWFLNWNLKRQTPLIPGCELPKRNPESEIVGRKNELLTVKVLPNITKFVKLLELPIVGEIGTNSVASSVFSDNGGLGVGKIKLYGGFVFTVVENNVLGFAAPDEFFVEDHEICVKDYVGEWKLNEAQILLLARQVVGKLGVDSRATAGRPRIDKPFGAAKEIVPRCLLYWKEKNAPSIRVEIDCAVGLVKSIMIW
jgi:hypothetical protein